MSTEDRAVDLEVDPDAPRRTGRVLVTNDDGIESPGLQGLARTLALDHDVVVAAPANDVSGSGTSIGRIDADDPTPSTRVDFDGIEAYAVAGPPGLAVMSAALGAFGPRPDLVVSGVNAGLNTGTSIIHSGTVGAALTGRTFGMSGLAISLAPGERWHWDTAMPVARAAARWILQQPGPNLLNVNVPGVGSGDVRGSRWASIDEFGHFRVAVQVRDGTAIGLDVRDRSEPEDPNCDTALCLRGYVTLTMLSALGGLATPSAAPEAVAGI